LNANTYVGTITDALGCTTTVTETVNEPAALASSFTSTQPLCHGDHNGSLTETPSGGTPPYTYSWNTSPIQTSATATGLGANSYTVTITDSLGCTTSGTTTLSEPAQLTTSTTSTQPSCNAGNNGTATTTPSGGTPNYTYSWSPSGGTGAIATGLSASTYTVTVTDANGCTATDNVTITQPTAIVVSAGQFQDVCGDAATLAADPLTTGFTGTWTATGTGTGTFTSPNSPTSGVTGLSLGNNTFQWTITDGTCSGSGTVTIQSDASIRADAGSDADTCANLSNQFILNAAQPQLGTGLWTVISGGGTVNNPTQYNSVFIPSGETNVLQWQVVNGACIDRDTVVLTYTTGGDCFELELPTAYSPNGDNHNDAYVIHGIESYPENKFVVFNRWGNEVYSIDNYKNYGAYDADWKGQNNSGDELPDGTYFVVLTIPKANISKNTYVDLRR